MEKKKNSKNYIIPASYFANKGITPIPVTKPKATAIAQTLPKKEKEITSEQKTVSETEESKKPSILLNSRKKSSSGLSLSSIKLKKEHQIRQMEVVLDEEDLPKDDFTEEALIKAWNDYVAKIEEQGQYNLASILSIDTPKVNGTSIQLEFPNATNKVEVERQQYNLLGYIRKELNNFDIHLDIIVNEELEKKYAYTPIEKYEKLKEKNKAIEILKKSFDLDV